MKISAAVLAGTLALIPGSDTGTSACSRPAKVNITKSLGALRKPEVGRMETLGLLHNCSDKVLQALRLGSTFGRHLFVRESYRCTRVNAAGVQK